jgi:predicted Ser/Thr protein kinase
MIRCPKCSAENTLDSRFCKSCAEPLSAPSQMPTMEAPVAGASKAAETPHHVARIISSDSIPAGGFTPGTILADRYRVIGLLGRGGMGEVYRADDLRLGQPVALKFLPPKLADDPVRRERFFAEVRITRQLSHPNICRVYDIGEIDGRHFLSMEFIDGEDLASLLKRIGHLTNEKALDIARQLAAGLETAHERGVLHRDLKPANIMLDGRGRVRITDFGLAVATEDGFQAEEIAGTPAYMAPEQLAGKGATVRSDIYSLGLILYEVYTGKKAFTAKTLAELREQKETRTPRAPSEIREGIDPVVERVIQRCMEKYPNSRPASVAQLAQALPGGDPLAAAITAGETPSPEMVAASGSKEGLRPAVAWAVLAFIIVGTIAILAMNDRVMLHRRISFEKPPDALIERSKEFLKKAGYSEKYADSDYGFMQNSDLLRYIENSDSTVDRWKNLDSQAILFWYRQSPRPLESHIASDLTYNPPLQYSAEVLVVLDTKGRLVSVRAMPPQVDSNVGAAEGPDWTVFFTEAGLDIAEWTRIDSQWNPPSYADTRIAWQGVYLNRLNTPLRIEAAAYKDKAVSFEIIGPWTRAAQMEPVQQRTGQRIAIMFAVGFLIALIAGASFFALRNLRLGRGDRRNATRLALLTIGILIISWALTKHHTQTGWELVQLLINVAFCFLAAGLFWILYVAIEPFVRRRWPKILISWTRLLSGEWRDPLVARDAFIGCAFGVLAFCGWRFVYRIIPSWFNIGEPLPPIFTLEAVLGANFFISTILMIVIYAIFFSLSMTCLLFLLQVLLRNQKAALVVSVFIAALAEGGGNYGYSALNLIFFYPVAFFVLMRFGLVASIFFYFYGYMLMRFPIGLETSAWYSGTGYAALAILAVIILIAFRTSVGGRPMFAAPQLDE